MTNLAVQNTATVSALPSTRVWPYDPWPDVPPGGCEMEFRLVFEGRLPAASQSSTRISEKHHIRRVLALQLAELWRTNRRLALLMEAQERYERGEHQEGAPGGRSLWVGGMHIRPPGVEYFSRCGRRFLPLITNRAGVGCALDILFLRRDQPGDLVKHGGDIDNRIKVLFDALRVPSSDQELEGANPADEPNPFHCLLEDDRLITDIKVTTDRLLTPLGNGEHLHDVRLIIHVRAIVIDPTNLAAVGF